MTNNSAIKDKIYIKTRIRIASFDLQLIKKATSNISSGVKKIDGRLLGPMRLPIKKRHFCLLNSPHVYKKSREHFRLCVYSRILDIYTHKDLVEKIELFGTIPIPAGVLIHITTKR